MELTLVQERISYPFVSTSISCLKEMAGLNEDAARGFKGDADTFCLNDIAAGLR